MLFEVDPEEIAAILALECQPHPETEFDERVFRDLIARSYSITKEEKVEIVTKAGTFSQFQIDELIRIMLDEREKFAELNRKHLERTMAIEKSHAQTGATSEASKDLAIAEIEELFGSHPTER